MIAQAASAYGADSGVLSEIARLESNFRPDAANNWDSNAKKGTPSKGMFQFIEPTFSAFSRQAKAANPGAWKGVNATWMDPYAQALTTAWAVKNGKGSHWATYGRAQAGKGKGPKASGVYTPQSGAVASAPASASQSAGLDPIIAMAMERSSANPSVVAGLQAMMQASAAAAPAQSVKAAPSQSLGAAQPYGGPMKNYKDLQAWAKRIAGATVQGVGQTTGGKHATGSYHYSGRAIDLGDATVNRGQFNKLAAYAKANPGQFREFFYNPLGWGIKNGKVVQGMRVSGHDDHLHTAV